MLPVFSCKFLCKDSLSSCAKCAQIVGGCINTHTHAHTLLYNLTPRSSGWNLLCGLGTYDFYGENENQCVFPWLRGRPVLVGVQSDCTLCVCLVYVIWLSQSMSLMQPITLQLCSFELGFVILHTAGASDCPAPANMNWLAKLQALWMSWLYLSSARHTVCLCLSPLRMRSGMPPMWTKTRPSTDGLAALQGRQHVRGIDCVALRTACVPQLEFTT